MADVIASHSIHRADPTQIRQAVEYLRKGHLVVFPTETVYGLGAAADNERAVARVFEAKGRPHFNPLIVHVSDLAAAEVLAVFSQTARELALRFWPGPLTLVLPRQPDTSISLLAMAGLDTIAIRVPAHPVALDLLRDFGGPIVAPSANPSGRLSPTIAAHVAGLGAHVAMILDGGPCMVGLESTIVGFEHDRAVLLRPGGSARVDIESITGPLSALAHGSLPSAPGQLASHYAPRARLRLNVLDPSPDEAFLAFGPDAPHSFGPSENLSPTGDVVEAAANLFADLRMLDATGMATIAVMPIPTIGLGEAINDRLARAAAPRDS